MLKFDLNKIDTKNVTPELLLDIIDFKYDILDIISSKTKPLMEDNYRIKTDEMEELREYSHKINLEKSKYWTNELKDYAFPIKFIKHTIKLLKNMENEFYESIELYNKSTDMNECKLLLNKCQDFITLISLTANEMCKYLMISCLGIDVITENYKYYAMLSELSGTICQIHNLLEKYDINDESVYYRHKGYIQAVFIVIKSFDELDLHSSIELYNKIGLLTTSDVDFIMGEYNKDDNPYKIKNNKYIN